MTTFVFAAVLCAALLHALWNSIVKSAGDKFLGSARVALWTGVFAAVVAAVAPAPLAAAAPFVVASAFAHVVYFVLVGALTATADLSVAYPLMRGFAPLVTTALAAATLGEIPSAPALAGVLALVAGVVTMGLAGLAHGRIDRSALALALVNSVVIASYSVIDGEGARLAGPDAAHAFGYNAWADGLTAALYLPLVLALRGRAALPNLLADPNAAPSRASPRSAATPSSSGR